MRIAAEYRVTVAGPGAIGSLVAARLARAGFTVHLLDHRPERAAMLARSGITVEEQDGTAWTARPVVSADPAAAAAGCECIIVCVKAYGTESLVRNMAPHLEPDATVLSLQNGLGNVEALTRLPVRAVLAGAAGIGALLSEPGRVRCTGEGVVWVAPASGDGEAARPPVAALRAAGFDARLHPDVRAMLWTKLILNAAINPATALYGLCNGELPGHPQAGPLARRIVSEAVAVAVAAGIPVGEPDMLAALEDVCRRTARNRSSMLRDVEAGRPTERHAITGAIVARADALGIPVPVNRRILEMEPFPAAFD